MQLFCHYYVFCLLRLWRNAFILLSSIFVYAAPLSVDIHLFLAHLCSSLTPTEPATIVLLLKKKDYFDGM